MKLLFDFFPILLFFIVFKFAGIYPATAVAMCASVTQVLLYRLKFQHFDKMQLMSLVIVMVLGGATLFFHNLWFIKWKPTGIYWITAVIFVASSFLSKKPLIQAMMDSNVTLETKIWHRLNTAWAAFFILMGAANLYVAYYYDTVTWVNFKLFGGVGFTLLFVLIQAFYLTKHMDTRKTF